MNTYFVLWTYVANYSTRPIEVKADSAKEAAQKIADDYSADFAKKATIFVFDQPPVFTRRR